MSEGLFLLFMCIITVPAQVNSVALSVQVRSGAPALRVTWDSSQSDVTITRYEVQYRTGSQWMSAADVTGSPPPTTTGLEGLQAGTSYSVRVRAVSNAGNGDWSNAAMQATYSGEWSFPKVGSNDLRCILHTSTAQYLRQLLICSLFHEAYACHTQSS